MTTQLRREELYVLVWAEPMVRLAPRYQMSDVALAKTCRRMDVPVPLRGYWRRKERGIVSPRPALPKAQKGVRDIVTLKSHEGKGDQPRWSSDVEAQIALEAQDAHRIRVSDRLAQPHALVRQTMEILQGMKPDEWGVLHPWSDRALHLRIGRDSLNRGLRVMDTVIKALEVRGFPVGISPGKKRETYVQIFGEQVKFYLEEDITRVAHVRTKKEEEDKRNRWCVPQWDYVQTGNLRLRIDEFWPSGARKTWSDGKKHRLEDLLNDVLVGMVIIADGNRTQKQEWARAETERQEAARERAIVEQERREEESRIQALEREADLWARSRQLRAYIDAVEQGGLLNGLQEEQECGLRKWLTWARHHADITDPLSRRGVPSEGPTG